MRKNKMIIILSVFFLLASCSQSTEKFLNINKPARTVYGNEQDNIILQNPTSRLLASCQTTDDVSADTCARLFESKGYVRITNIPYKTANYDKLRTDTYPTRRWRGNERSPRW